MVSNANIVKYKIKNIISDQQEVVDFSFYTFEHFLSEAEHLKESHRHDFYTFILTLQGSGSHIIDFEEYQIKPNRLFFINYDQVHSWDITSNVKGYIILFSKSFYNLVYTGNDLVKSDTAVENLPVYADIDDKDLRFWLNTCENIQLEFEKGIGASNEVISLLLKTCVLQMEASAGDQLQAMNTADHKNRLVHEFRKMVNLYFKEKKTTKDYAEPLSITPNYLNALVKDKLGKSAGMVIRNRIILEAKRLLSHTVLPVRQIALELGFTDNSHFGKYFKNATQTTPETFRKNFNNKEEK